MPAWPSSGWACCSCYARADAGGSYIDRAKTEVIRRRYDRLARFYDLFESPMESGALDRWRRHLWDMVEGQNVLEVGVGTGRNMKYYPPGIHVTAIDFSERMLEKARSKAARLRASVDLHLMDVQHMSFPDASFDSVVSTCVFCSVPDPVLGLSEVRRVLKPGGKALMLEHVRSLLPLLGPIMDIFNPLSCALMGVNINRDTASNIRSAGLRLTQEQNLWLDILKLFVAEG